MCNELAALNMTYLPPVLTAAQILQQFSDVLEKPTAVDLALWDGKVMLLHSPQCFFLTPLRKKSIKVYSNVFSQW